MDNINEMFGKSVIRYCKNPCLGSRPDGNSDYSFMTYEEVDRHVKAVAGNLKEMGVEKGDKIAILSENRPEWAIFDLATLALGAVDVPLYNTLRPEEITSAVTKARFRSLE